MKFHLVIASPSFEEGLVFFLEELGFVIDEITPSETPSLAVLSGYGLTICLDKNAELEPVTLRVATEDKGLLGTEKVGPNGTKVVFGTNQGEGFIPVSGEPSFALNEAARAEWTTGRAGMKYRNLLAGGTWDYIASHIKIPGSGTVPDWVHYHDVNFQIIYCYKGAAKLVYEDQGPPFLFKAGDCVLQPPHIRHQVLESYEDLEVIEVVTPLNHSTLSDHVMNLPNEELNPDRDFKGQRFIWDQAKNRDWKMADTSQASLYQIGETGIGEASARQGDVRILRPVESGEDIRPLVHVNEENRSDFVLWFVLSGTTGFDRSSGIPLRTVRASDAISIIGAPPEYGDVVFRDPSSDFSVLEVRLPQETL